MEHPQGIPHRGYLTKKRGEWPVEFYPETHAEVLAGKLWSDPRLQAWAVTIHVVDEVKAVPPTRPTLILAAVEREED